MQAPPTDPLSDTSHPDEKDKKYPAANNRSCERKD